MSSTPKCWTVSLLSALLGYAVAAHAANSGAPDPQILLGPLPTYPAESAAHAACAHDAVVWADRYSGTYYTKDEPQFAATPNGAYACMRDATRSNYWDTSPLSSMAQQPGRVFPYQPLYPSS